MTPDERSALERELCLKEAVLEACKQALAGQEPCDFLLSFDPVRYARDLHCAVCELREMLK